MNVCLVNTYDRGGAANSCYRLHRGLLHIGLSSEVLLRFKQEQWPQASLFKPVTKHRKVQEKIRGKVTRMLNELHLSKPHLDKEKEIQKTFLSKRATGLEMFSFPNDGLNFTESNSYKEASLINLHWVANFLDYSSFFKVNTKPVVWTLHDMNPFSGGEHYEEKYLGIDNDGYPIIRERSQAEEEISKKNLALKKKALEGVKDLTIVSPSKWLAEEAKNSELFSNYSVHHIPNGLDENIYKPMDKEFSRNVLNIPLDKQVILFVADSISNHRKGFAYLKRALEELNNTDVVLCAIGAKNSALQSFSNVMELGSIYDERLMSMAYSAADVFVIPSLMDNLPNTVLESLLCGTPVIGFPIGGIPDMVQDGVNGYLTDEISVLSLNKTIDKFLLNPDVFDSKQIRQMAVKKYALEVQAKAYKELFQNILSK